MDHPNPRPSTPRYSPTMVPFCTKARRSSDERRYGRASYEIRLRRFLTACTIQIVLLSAGDVLEKSTVASRSRDSGTNDSRVASVF